MQTIHEFLRASNRSPEDLLDVIVGHVQRGDCGEWSGVPGWNPNFAIAMSWIPDLTPLVVGWRTLPEPTRTALGVELARRGLLPGEVFSAERLEMMMDAEIRGHSDELFFGLESVWSVTAWQVGMVARILAHPSPDYRTVERYILHITEPDLLLQVAYRGMPRETTWRLLESRLSDMEPVLIADAEGRLLAGPEAIPGHNDGQRPILGTLLGVIAARRGEAIDPRYMPFLAVACQQAPSEDHLYAGRVIYLQLLAEALAPLSISQREVLVLQHMSQIPLLAWRLAVVSDTLTTQVARRAAWKIADLGRRRNHGGTSMRPNLDQHERDLFPALGAVAVPEILRELRGNPRRKDFLIEVLGHTACPQAAEPLVWLMGEGSKTQAELAAAGVKRLIQQGHGEAVRAAAEQQAGQKKAALQAGAAAALAML